jgi:hypothetical protein
MQDRLVCEDVVLFANAAVTSTGQREFRSGAADQRLSVDFLHRYMLGNYRDLYAATRAPAGTPVAQRRLEGRLIARRLERMPLREVLGVLQRRHQR